MSDTRSERIYRNDLTDWNVIVDLPGESERSKAVVELLSKLDALQVTENLPTVITVQRDSSPWLRDYDFNDAYPETPDEDAAQDRAATKVFSPCVVTGYSVPTAPETQTVASVIVPLWILIGILLGILMALFFTITGVLVQQAGLPMTELFIMFGGTVAVTFSFSLFVLSTAFFLGKLSV